LSGPRRSSPSCPSSRDRYPGAGATRCGNMAPAEVEYRLAPSGAVCGRAFPMRDTYRRAMARCIGQPSSDGDGYVANLFRCAGVFVTGHVATPARFGTPVVDALRFLKSLGST
jgi:hypothetical protein